MSGTVSTARRSGPAEASSSSLGPWKSRSPADRKALFEEIPPGLQLKINQPYPTTLPLVSAPAKLLARWLFGGSDGWVKDVMAGGKWVVKDRHHAGEEAAQRAFGEAMSALMAA